MAPLLLLLTLIPLAATLSAQETCGNAGTTLTRTTMYFGLARPAGTISESHERAKVLMLVHPDSPEMHASVAAIIAEYKRAFQQESVLWETARVCAAF